MKVCFFRAITLTAILLASCAHPKQTENTPMNSLSEKAFQNGYATVNGLTMYYEIHGKGEPLVLLHGGGSTIETSFGRIIPKLSTSRQLICIELQAHGRTGDRNTPISFQQDADDVAALLKNLGFKKVDVFGFSNGGNTALQLAIRHPALCNKIIAGSVLLKRDGAPSQFWDFMNHGTFDQMPQAYKEAFLNVTPDSAKLLTMYTKCANRMINFTDFSDQELKSIQPEVLLINGTADVATPEHMDAMAALIPACSVLTLPGGHGEYMGEITTLKPGFTPDTFVELIEKFLKTP